MIDKTIMELPNSKKILGMLAGLAVLQALFIIGQAYSLASIITRLWLGQRLGEQIWLLLLFILVFTARHGVTYLRDKILDAYAAKEAAELRKQLLEKIFRMGPKIVQKKGSGNMITMALDGIEQVENYIHLIFSKIMNMMIVSWPILAVAFYLDIESGIVLLAIYPLIILFMIVLGYAAQAKADKQYKAFQLLSNHFIDSLRGIDTLKMFGLSKSYGKSVYQTSENFRKSTMSTLKIGILSTFALDFFTTLAVAIVAVLLGLRLINNGIDLFPALMALILAPEYFLPLREFASDYHATLDGKNALGAISQALAEPETEPETAAIASWDNDSTLSLADVQVSYGQRTALQADFSVRGFQKVGIIGLSGSGKSTLINTLSGFLKPKRGQIRLNGISVQHFSAEEWQQQLLYIPQDPYIFQLSLRQNIAFYTPMASEKEILAAVEVAGLTELIEELPQGLDTQIGGGARPLSGGQAQRIALARAFLDKKRKVLLFDEPTAHLDIETEVELKERMLPLMEDHLVFFATHRLHWMHQMDLILVVDHGRIIESGTFAELTAKHGYFYQLTRQMRGNEDE